MPQMSRRPLLQVLILLLVMTGHDLSAADQRPKVALVLSGGGARGAAHAGVIRVLEEMRIPIDLVVGTSMGSIMGGFYAIGYNADEIDQILAESDWSMLFSDKPARDLLWYRRRQDDRIFQVDLEVGWKNGGIATPSGFILGLNAETFLEHLFLPVAGINDFDALPIPFRCVATDALTGQSVAPTKGELATAIRASMSIPGVFAPVSMDGRTLIDGGVVDNLPVRLARELGADIIIAVDLADEADGDVSGWSAMGVFNQMLRILMQSSRESALKALRDHDVVIRPLVSDIGIMEFDRYAKAIELGVAAAKEQSLPLAALSVPADAYRAWREQVLAARPKPLTVREVRVVADTGLSPAVLAEHVAILPGQPLDSEQLRLTRAQIAGLGIYQHVDLVLHPVAGAADQTDVIVRAQEKSWGPNYFRFGLGVTSDLQGDGEFDVGIQHTLTPVNGLGGEWRNEIQIGTRGRVFTEFYQPLDHGLRWFVAPNGQYAYDSLPLIIDREAVAEFDVDLFSAGLEIGRNLGYWGEFRIGYVYESGTAEPTIFPPNLPRETIQVEEHTLRAQLTIDLLDNWTLPTRGFFAQFGWQERLQDFTYGDDKSVLSGTVSLPVTFANLTLLGSIEGGSALAGDPGLGGEFYLGGFRRLSGLSPYELPGDQLVLGVLQTYYRFGHRTTALSIAPFVGGTVEAGNVWAERSQVRLDDLLLAGSLYLGAQTIIGQCYLGAGLSEGGEYALYVFIGPTF